MNIAAPCIGDTAPEQFSQQEFWRESPDMTHTALDLVAAALAEARLIDARKLLEHRAGDETIEDLLAELGD